MSSLKKLLPILLFTCVAFAASSCKKDKIEVSEHDLWFEADGGTKTINVTATYGWRVQNDDEADWFTVTPSSTDESQSTITINVEPLDAAAEGFRRGSISILSPKGGAQIVVHISQGDVEFKDIYNLVFGVTKEERWNTDYYGLMIEDSYKCFEFDPCDTTTGFWLYFFENGIGVQVDRCNDTVSSNKVIYYMFSYTYDIASRKLEYSFQLVDGTIEHYNLTIITATPELFRFEQEYEPHFWERSDMKKIGTIDPDQKALMLNRAVKKRKEAGPVFRIK